MFPTAESKQGCEKVFELLGSFTTQTKCLDLELFAMQRQKKRILEIHLRYLKVFKVDPEKTYREEHLERPWRHSWEELQADEKTTYLSNLAIRTIAQHCYGFKGSAWNPTQTVAELIQQLQDHGPLFVSGRFGRSYYKTPPVTLLEKKQNRNIWYWPTATAVLDTTPQPTHSVVIIGATVEGSRGGVVYFVDPLDGSDPRDLEKQKIYAMSYQRLTENIHDLFGEQYRVDTKAFHNPKFLYGWHGTLSLSPVEER